MLWGDYTFWNTRGQHQTCTQYLRNLLVVCRVSCAKAISLTSSEGFLVYTVNCSWCHSSQPGCHDTHGCRVWCITVPQLDVGYQNSQLTLLFCYTYTVTVGVTSLFAQIWVCMSIVACTMQCHKDTHYKVLKTFAIYGADVSVQRWGAHFLT